LDDEHVRKSFSGLTYFQTNMFRGPDWMKRVEQLQFFSQRQNKLSACGTIGVPIIQN